MNRTTPWLQTQKGYKFFLVPLKINEGISSLMPLPSAVVCNIDHGIMYRTISRFPSCVSKSSAVYVFFILNIYALPYWIPAGGGGLFDQ
jgi:hypothetical protein